MTYGQNTDVFVVERDPHVCRLVRHLIGDAYAVEVFETGYTALDRIRRSPPALLITEILIPELDGLALCRLLKSDASTCDVPVLIFSILASAVRAKNAGADGFLQKPIEKAQLLLSVRALTISRERSGRPSFHEQDSP